MVSFYAIDIIKPKHNEYFLSKITYYFFIFYFFRKSFICDYLSYFYWPKNPTIKEQPIKTVQKVRKNRRLKNVIIAWGRGAPMCVCVCLCMYVYRQAQIQHTNKYHTKFPERLKP